MESEKVKEIKKDIAALKGRSSSEVIYCIDTDKYDSDAEVQKLNADIEKLSEPINGEIPILIDLKKHKEVLESGTWLKIDSQEMGI